MAGTAADAIADIGNRIIDERDKRIAKLEAKVLEREESMVVLSGQHMRAEKKITTLEAVVDSLRAELIRHQIVSCLPIPPGLEWRKSQGEALADGKKMKVGK